MCMRSAATKSIKWRRVTCLRIHGRVDRAQGCWRSVAAINETRRTRLWDQPRRAAMRAPFWLSLLADFGL